MMNIVFLSPHFPPNFYHFCSSLKELGVRVLGLGSESYEHLCPELKEALTEYYRVHDMENDEQLLRAMGYFIHHYGKIDAVESLNEHWLKKEAMLRTDFNISGIKVEDLQYVRNKSFMKKMFREAGVPVVEGRVIKTLEEGLFFIEEVGYPVVVKPDRGVGAIGTLSIHSEKELYHFFDEKMDVPYFIEEFIDGQLYSFDGLTDQEGQIVFATAHYFSQGIMEVVNRDQMLYYYSLKEVPSKLFGLGSRIIDIYNIKSRFFHIEFFKRPNGEYVALEINMRPPGGYTVDMFNYAHDMDIFRGWASVMVKNHFDANPSHRFHACYISRKDRFSYEHSHEEVMARERVVFHGKNAWAWRGPLGDDGYIVKSLSLEEVHEEIDFIQKTW